MDPVMRLAARRFCLLSALFPALLIGVPPARGEVPTPISVEWREASVEEAVTATARAAGDRLSVLVDSYPGEKTRGTLVPTTDRPAAILEQLARDYRRVLFRKSGAYLLRSSRWFDPSTHQDTPPGSRKQPRAIVFESGPNSRISQKKFRVALVHGTLKELAAELSRHAGETHRVEPSCGSRRLSGRLTDLKAGEIRNLVAALYPDLEWRPVGTTRVLAPKPTADFIRTIAVEAARHDDAEYRVRGAAFVQAASEVQAGQVEEFRRTGELQIGWRDLSAAGRQLFGEWLKVKEGIYERSGTPQEFRADPSRVEALALTFVASGDRLRLSTRARTHGGLPMRF